MNFFTRAREWIKTLLSGRIKDEFDIDVVSSPEVGSFVNDCWNIYQGRPSWVDADNHIDTVNFAKSVCSEIARLTTLGAKVTIDGSPRGEWLQEQIDKAYFSLRQWVEYAAAGGTIILKPTDNGIDYVLPENFEVTAVENGEIRGAVFYDVAHDATAKKWYTRLEWHRFEENGDYAISNRCFVSDTENGKGKPIAIELTPWAALSADDAIKNVDGMLFGVLRMPEANNIDPHSVYGLPVFAGAVKELRDLDVAYSRFVKEVWDSKRIVLLDSDRLTPSGVKINPRINPVENAGLPDYIKAVQGAGANDDIYHEINPTLNTDTRLSGINALLSQIGYKCGFSNGYFVFNEQHGIATATQIEADQQRTIQLIKDVRDKLESCLDGLIYALDKYADLYNLAPVGVYEVNYDFGDITYNLDEDRARWLGYVTAGRIAFWRYLVKFEGMTEDEAKEIAAETQQIPTLFGEEE